MEMFIRVAAIAIVASVMAVLLKKNTPEISLLLVLAAAMLIIGVFLDLFGTIRDFINTLAQAAGLSSAIITPLIKTIGVAIVCKLATEVCKDASQNTIASVVEIVGAVTALYIALPLMSTAIEMIGSLI